MQLIILSILSHVAAISASNCEILYVIAALAQKMKKCGVKIHLNEEVSEVLLKDCKDEAAAQKDDMFSGNSEELCEQDGQAAGKRRANGKAEKGLAV